MEPDDRAHQEEMHQEGIHRDEMLCRAVRAGDENAWQVWYNATFDELYAYVLWRSGGRRDRADEVTQETWLTAVGKIRRFDPRKGSFLDWMRGIAANVLRHDHRDQQRRLNREQAVGRCDEAESACDDRERRDQIAAALSCLPERQEAVLRAKYLDGLSMAEIAAKWNESLKAVESLLSRARQAFREFYDKERPNNKLTKGD